MEILLIGVNHRTAPVELRERVAFRPEQAVRATEELRSRGVLDEAVVLSTCNRSELYGVASAAAQDALGALEGYFSAIHLLPPAELNGCLYRHRNLDAARHLFRVASGLDSMLLGEAEILGQVRQAYTQALEHHATGPVLNRLFQGALEIGKRVRAETELGARPMSVAYAGVKLAERVFGKLRGHQALIVGAGAVGEQVVEHMRARGIAQVLVANRTGARAEELARQLGGAAVPWEALDDHLAGPDVVVTSASAADGFVLNRARIERAMARRANRALFLIDLGVPRNVEPAAGGLYNVYLYNIDDLAEIVEQNKKAREEEIPRAEALIEAQVEKFLAWQESVEALTLFGELRQKLQHEREEFLRERFEKIGQLSSEERQRVARLTEELLDRILEEPAHRLRTAREVRRRIQEVEALREVFGLTKERP
jgi:glutamyl-tRNA reductase